MRSRIHALTWGRFALRIARAGLAIPLLAGAVPAQQASAQERGRLPLKTVWQIEELLAAKAQRTPAQRKVSSQLLDAAGESIDESRQAKSAALAEERVMVDIRADVSPEVLSRIQALGGTVTNSVPKYRAIRARLPIAAVEKLAALDAVQSIRPADVAFTRDRSARLPTDNRHGTLESVVTRVVDTSEGDVAHRANVARSTHSVDGTGIGIGVISDGVATLADQQATGDVPSRVTVLHEQEGSAILYRCGGTSAGSEGTAMLEIVHDLAPSAELFFATGINGSAQMAQNIEDLCAAGADIIVDDIGYPASSVFQDDVISQAVSAAVADGCYYFSSAGNGGNKNDGTAGVWEGDFAAGSTLTVNGVAVGTAHDFGGGVIRNRIKRNSTSSIYLQWADPEGGSANDYDLFLVDADDNVLDSSTNTQDGTQDPLERIRGSCSDDLEDNRLIIVKTTSAADRYLRLEYAVRGLEITTDGHTFGHSASEDAIGVAAIDVRDAGGSGGVFNGTESVETFSSDGPRRIFFEPDGTPITAGSFISTGGKLLQKPDLAAANCVSTSTPGFSTFCGTSAAAPHAAAIAALMLEAAGGPANVTQSALSSAMTGASLDIEATGVDRDSGAGIVMAPGAVDAVDVALADRNQAPEAQSELADRTILRGGSAVTVSFESAFSEPDDETLTYNAMSSDTDRVTVTRTGSQLTLTPGLPGFAEVTVRAADPSGLSAVQSFSVTVALGSRDYDVDDDNLIDVGNLAQLDAVRYDLNGDGVVDDASDWQSYYSASAFAQSSLTGCPDECSGYELTASLDFDTNNSGAVGPGDTYWNGGEGWVPIGGADSSHRGTLLFLRNPFTATFEGNGHTVRNLLIDTDDIVLVGLFGYATSSIRNLGVIDVDVTSDDLASGLIGFNRGEIRASYVTGRVTGKENVGGLVGINRSDGEIDASYASSHVSGEEDVGGLVGDNRGKITAGYATGRVSGIEGVGGLVGNNQSDGEIDASYATGLVAGQTDVGGLVGKNEGTITDSYWDERTSGHMSGSFGQDKTTAQLQTPTGSSGIYQNWNLDLDGDSVNDWHFGTSSQYPVLAVDTNGAGGATWQEFGYQLREGPMLTATAGTTQVELSWTAVNRNHWSSMPTVSYTLYREDGTSIETLTEGTGGLQYTDSDVTAGATYTYQVAAVVTGGEAAHSARVLVIVSGTIMPPPPPPPQPDPGGGFGFGSGGGGGGSRTTVPGPQGFTLDFPHFANGGGITSEVVLLNVGAAPIRPVLYFSDPQGKPIAATAVVEVTDDLEVSTDGGLTLRTEIEPLGELTVATHGRGAEVSGSVRVVAEGAPLGGVLRYSVPGVGVIGVGAGMTVRDALFPARRQQGGIRTAAALHNPGEAAIQVSCALMSGGAVWEETTISLEPNGQTSWFLEDEFTMSDTTDFAGTVRCRAPREGEYTGLAVEVDGANRIFTTLPAVPVERTGGEEAATVLYFAHFANGGNAEEQGIRSELVLLNVETRPSGRGPTPFHPTVPENRPVIYFYDREGRRIDPASVVDLTDDLEVTDDDGLTIRTAMEPLGELTVATHGRGEEVSGSVKVVSEGATGGVLRYRVPGVGVTGVDAGVAVRDALFPARRKEGGIRTAAALRNVGEEAIELTCRLMSGGEVLEEAAIPLAGNGQTSWFIEEAFTGTDTTDFTGTVRCRAPEEGEYTGLAVEVDGANRIFTTLPVVPVEERMAEE